MPRAIMTLLLLAAAATQVGCGGLWYPPPEAFYNSGYYGCYGEDCFNQLYYSDYYTGEESCEPIYYDDAFHYDWCHECGLWDHWLP